MSNGVFLRLAMDEKLGVGEEVGGYLSSSWNCSCSVRAYLLGQTCPQMLQRSGGGPRAPDEVDWDL